MKKLTLFIFLFINFFGVSSQTSTEEKSAKYKKFERNYNYTKGYIITTADEKINGLIKVKASEVGQFTSVKFVHYSGVKQTYYPSGIKAFGYYSKRFESINNSFYQIEVEGRRIELLKNVSVSYGVGVMVGVAGGGMTPMMTSNKNETKYLRNVETGELTKVRRIDFKTSCMQYFSDCPSIVEKIKSKEYRFRDLNRIVRAYNSCALTNNEN